MQLQKMYLGIFIGISKLESFCVKEIWEVEKQ